MTNTYTWTYVGHDTRVVHDVPATAGSKTLTPCTCVNAVMFACTATDESGNTGTFMDRVCIGDPLAHDTALTDLTDQGSILSAAQYALGWGGIERWQSLADAAITSGVKTIQDTASMQGLEVEVPINRVSVSTLIPSIQPAFILTGDQL